MSNRLKTALKNDRKVQFLEILSLFLIAYVILKVAYAIAGDDIMLKQLFVWITNIVMLLFVWLGLRLRGQTWSHFGLKRDFFKIRTFLLSLLVFAAGLSGFIIGSIIMANITGIPESADMSGYNYLQGDLLMLLVALTGVFIVSSFGEEVIYRGFLITRISEMGGNHKTWVKFAVVISSIIFGLIHFEWGPMGIVQTGFMGLALGISYILVKRNLWILVLAHAYMDAILMIQLYLG